ncbi:MAG: type II toxin-antitoxin system VapC family toxin [Proteobacteria bacterium]|nr:type II toxin-antitoxin system VapC family toxin [Pseudomonadota bacterium]
MQYLLDTVAVIRYFSGTGKIGSEASTILEKIEDHNDILAISVISLMEIMYLAEKNRIAVNLMDTLERIEASSKYLIINLSSDILRVAESMQFPELHDRLILATARWLEIPIISSDSEFGGIPGIHVIWNR